jgi:hypothetical protein
MTTDALVSTGLPQGKLHLDEKVEWIWERDETRGILGHHRIQHIQLVRGGKMRHFFADMGSQISHPHWQPYNFWAAGVYSVGECLEIGENLRESKPPEWHQPVNLAQSYLNLLEEKQKRRVHASEFGPYIKHER